MPIIQQRTAPYVFASFVGGYMSTSDEDPLMLPKQYLSECQNCLVENGYVRKALGWIRLMNPDSFQGIGQGIFLLRTSMGNEEVLFLTTTNLYVYDAENNAFIDQTPAGGLSGTVSIAPQIIAWLDSAFITNGIDPIIQKQFGQQATFLNQNGAPVSAMSIAVFTSQLFALAPTDSQGYHAWRVQWSDFRNPSIWNAGQAGAVDLDDTQEEIMAAEVIDRWLAIAKTHTWYIVTFIGPPVVFDFRRRDTDGVLARRTLVRLPSGLGLFALGPSDVIIFDGNNSTPIGKPIRKELFSQLNSMALNTCVAFRDDLRGRMYLSIATAADIPDLTYTYSYIDGPWMRETPRAGGGPKGATGAPLGGASFDYFTPLLIDEMVFPIDFYDVQIRDLFKNRQQRVLITDGSGLFAATDQGQQDGQPIDARFVTAAIAPGIQQDGSILPVTVMSMMVEGNFLPGLSQISLRAWFGNMRYTTIGPFQLFFTGPISQVIPCEVSGSYFQVIIQNNNLGEVFQIKQVTLRFLVRGRV